jgi:hypothetical protein
MEGETTVRKPITTLAVAASMVLLAMPAAFANSDNSNDVAGAGTTECRPGAENNDLISSWELMDKAEYIADVTAVLTERFETGYYGDMTEAEFDELLGSIPDRADATWTFCDKNRDGFTCVMNTDPSPYYWTILDNRPFPS